MAEHRTQLQMTKMPNYIKMIVPGAGETWMPIESLSEKEAKKYSKEMAAAFLKHWQHRQTNPVEPKTKSFSQEEGI